MKQKIALLLGASGSVGSALLSELLKQNSYSQVIAFLRKPLSNAPNSTKLVQTIDSEFTPASLTKVVGEMLGKISSEVEVAAFSALGVGANTAKLTIEQHRAVDVALNQAFAAACSSRAKTFALLSSVGADPTAKESGNGAAGMPRYLRVKGESEEAVKAAGLRAVGIFRPAMIRGSQHTPKVFDWVAPGLDLIAGAIADKKYHSITTQQIAEAMIAASLLDAPESATYEFRGMKALIDRTR